MDKVEQTLMGVMVSLVMPLPGSIEVMALHAGATWLEEDLGKRHMVVEHSAASSIKDQLDGFDLAPPPSLLDLVEAWQSSGEKTVLIHNASSRAVVVTCTAGELGFM